MHEHYCLVIHMVAVHSCLKTGRQPSCSYYPLLHDSKYHTLLYVRGWVMVGSQFFFSSSFSAALCFLSQSLLVASLLSFSCSSFATHHFFFTAHDSFSDPSLRPTFVCVAIQLLETLHPPGKILRVHVSGFTLE